jgi:hypothetical protein
VRGKSQRAKAFYAFAALPFLLSVIVTGWILLANLRSMTGGLVRAIVPGKATIHLTHGGLQTVFYEYESRIGNQVFHTSESFKEMDCSLHNLANGAKVLLRRSRGGTSYTYTGHFSGYSVLEFRLEQSGEYELSCDYADPAGQQQLVFAIGADQTGAIFKLVSIEILILFLGIGVSAVGIASVYRKRNHP